MVEQMDNVEFPPSRYVRQNVIAKVVGFPDWMGEELKNSLTVLVEIRARTIDNIYTGKRMERNAEGRLTIDDPYTGGPRFLWDELADKLVQKVFMHWAEEGLKAQEATSGVHQELAKVGIDILFYEPNATFTGIVSAWKGVDLFPSDTGIMEGACVKDSKVTVYHEHGIVFPCEKLDQSADVHEEAKEALADFITTTGGISGIPAYLREIADQINGMREDSAFMDVYVKIDADDPDPVSTIRVIHRSLAPWAVRIHIYQQEGDAPQGSLSPAAAVANAQAQAKPISDLTMCLPVLQTTQEFDEWVAEVRAGQPTPANSPDAAIARVESCVRDSRLFKREDYLATKRPDLIARYDALRNSLSVDLGDRSETDIALLRNGATSPVVEHYYETLHGWLSNMGIPETPESKVAESELPEGWVDPTKAI